MRLFDGLGATNGPDPTITMWPAYHQNGVSNTPQNPPTFGCDPWYDPVSGMSGGCPQYPSPAPVQLHQLFASPWARRWRGLGDVSPIVPIDCQIPPSMPGAAPVASINCPSGGQGYYMPPPSCPGGLYPDPATGACVQPPPNPLPPPAPPYPPQPPYPPIQPLPPRSPVYTFMYPQQQAPISAQPQGQLIAGISNTTLLIGGAILLLLVSRK